MSDWSQPIPAGGKVKVSIGASDWPDEIIRQMQNFVASLLVQPTTIGGADINGRRVVMLTTRLDD